VEDVSTERSCTERPSKQHNQTHDSARPARMLALSLHEARAPQARQASLFVTDACWCIVSTTITEDVVITEARHCAAAEYFPSAGVARDC